MECFTWNNLMRQRCRENVSRETIWRGVDLVGMFHVKHSDRASTWPECFTWNNLLGTDEEMFHVKHFVAGQRLPGGWEQTPLRPNAALASPGALLSLLSLRWEERSHGKDPQTNYVRTGKATAKRNDSPGAEAVVSVSLFLWVSLCDAESHGELYPWLLLQKTSPKHWTRWLSALRASRSSLWSCSYYLSRVSGNQGVAFL
jgi:hypothetical protein